MPRRGKRGSPGGRPDKNDCMSECLTCASGEAGRDPELKRKSLHYYFIILVFAIGAAIGAVASQKFGNPAIWIAAGLMLLGFILMFVKEEIQGETE